jgi:1-deoxy-D-xylulose-5-phosphate reductoisomerase
MNPMRIVLVGSTGSIGTQTLDVVEHLNAVAERAGDGPVFRVVGLAAGSNAALLAEQAARFGVPARAVALADTRADLPEFAGGVSAVRRGASAAEELVRAVEADLVVAAVVGAAGLPATLAAIELGRDVALANKETLVAAGSLVTERLHAHPASRRPALLPIDSEHSGVWQCLDGLRAGSDARACAPPPFGVSSLVRRVTLTASGGPFRTWSAEQIARATPAEAIKHPTWSMGGKITIDSATLMNKSLELIEAHWLFDLAADQLDVLVHPQSIVHALVETVEGSVIAQLGVPDMRTPIQLALTHGRRRPAAGRRLDLAALGTLTFEPVDVGRFPAAAFWRRCISPEARGTTSGAILNAANEEAVHAFLKRSGPAIAFARIAELAAAALDGITARPLRTLDDALSADAEAREFVRARITS